MVVTGTLFAFILASAGVACQPGPDLTFSGVHSLWCRYSDAAVCAVPVADAEPHR